MRSADRGFLIRDLDRRFLHDISAVGRNALCMFYRYAMNNKGPM